MTAEVPPIAADPVAAPVVESAPAGAPPAPMRRMPGRVSTFFTTIRAVLTRELRWRMRGKRAFVIATLSVLFLGLIVFLVYQLLYQGAVDESRWRLAGPFDDGGFDPTADLPFAVNAISGSASARIGQSIFGAVLGVLTALTLLIAPALAGGVISSEREKQTLELLVTTPVSTLGMLIGKLVASLAYILLLIIASVPLMAIVFAFGGVAPEDVLRAYLVIVVIAFAAGAMGMFLSALVGRTQVATVISYLVLFGLVVGTFALHTWIYSTSVDFSDPRAREEDRNAPEALLWLNPLITDIDLMCTAVPDTRVFCDYIEGVAGMDRNAVLPPRDAWWPRSVAAMVLTGVLLILVSTQLISPSRRFRWRRRRPAASPPPLASPDAA